MKAKCQTCGLQDLRPGPVRIYRHTVASLGWPLQVDRLFICAKCGRELRTEQSYRMSHTNPALSSPESGNSVRRKAEPLMASVTMMDNAGRLASVQYSAVCLPNTREVLPTREGTIQDGTMVDQYGDPELMARFAEQYLSSFRTQMPSGRLPRTVVEMMPALHQLLIAAELVMKADLMRSEKGLGNQHSLQFLYKALECPHRQDAEQRFARSEPNTRLTSTSYAAPNILDVLTVYDQSYGGASKVYIDTRYYAEPTTKFAKPTGLHGGRLIKSNTPYPIFLPHVVESLVEAFRFFDGAARLQRLGGDVMLDAQELKKATRRSWSLVPASLGLVVVRIPQDARMDANHKELPEFRRWKRSRPAGYSTSWMYGGAELLFYRADKDTPPDSATEIDGIKCRVYRDGRLKLHSRDLYRLADSIELGRVSQTL